MIELSIVVPVYKSQKILPELLRRIDQYISSMHISYEVILVDDDSRDGTWEEIQNLKDDYSFVRAYKNSVNIGQPMTSALGISKTLGKYIVTIDDDLEYCPSDIVVLYRSILSNNANVVFGIADGKYAIQGKNQTISKWRNVLLNQFWQKPVTDSFKIFRRSLAFDNEIFRMNTHFEGHLKKNINQVGLIKYVNVSYYPRFQGQSNYTFWRKMRMFFQMHRGFR